ncbi:MAG: LPS export ABC transporter permease LptF [Acidocella sp.]|nr:LPS export ABC transporter permease LptF [Acidocella sp.]
MILNRYLTREISRPFAVILGILCVLFTGYSVASLLSDAVSGLLPTLTIMELTGLKLLIALDVLIPISLYFAVLLSFGRLYGDSEFTAMWALGVQPTQIARIVLSLAGIVALAVAAFSLEVRPWAYRTSHSVTWHGATSLDVNAMQAGTFYASEDGQRVIFLTHRAGPGTPAQDVFVRRQLADHTEVIFAKLASSLQQKAASGQHEVYLTDAHVYEIYPPETAQNDQILNAQGLIIDPESAPGAAPGYNPITAGSLDLVHSTSPRDIAELEWRLSTPISTLLLALLAVPLSYSRVRQGKYAKFGQAILIYAGYYLLCTTARTWVEHGTIGTLPGIWWAPALLTLVLAMIIAAPQWRNRRAAKARAAATEAGANAS